MRRQRQKSGRLRTRDESATPRPPMLGRSTSDGSADDRKGDLKGPAESGISFQRERLEIGWTGSRDPAMMHMS